MRSKLHLPVLLIGWMCLTGLTSVAQQSQSAPNGATAAASVPNLIKYSGVLRDGSGAAITSLSGVTFLIYQDEQGGAPLWMETQNVQPDKAGHYTVQLGAASKDGIPTDLFMNGEARWLGVQAQGQQEQPRVMLSSVPYAIKAGDAQTVGGLPASAFVLAAPSSVVGSGATSSAGRVSKASGLALASITGSGTAGFLPQFTGTATISNSAVFQSGSSPTAKVGINTSTPTANLDVNGSANVRGKVNATGVVSASAYNIGSNPFAFGSYNRGNALLGFAGNSTMTGVANTAAGFFSLANNTTGQENTAAGSNALQSNTTGYGNAAVGNSALVANTAGGDNTAMGYLSLEANALGDLNTAVGSFTLAGNRTGQSNAAGGSSLL